MKLDKEQRNQFIVLCVLLAVVMGFGVYRMIGVGTSASPLPDTVKPAQNAQAADENGTPKSTAGDPQSDEPVAAAIGFVRPQKEPFEPQEVPEAEQSSASTTTPTPTRRLPLISQESVTSSLPVMPVFGSQSPTTMPTPLVVQEDPTKDLRLTGVIEGDVKIAIIRGAGDSRHFVREGQSIDGKLYVRSISRSGVRLSYSGRSYYLPLGPSK